MNTSTPRRFPFPLPSVRIILGLAALAAVLAYALPLAATRLIGQETLRAHAQAALSAALERPVDIQGDVRLTMIPWFGLRTGPVTVPNEPGFGPEPLLSVESATIGLRLTALASHTVVVDSVALSSASLRLERDAGGRENWRGLSGGDALAGHVPGGWKVESLPSGLRLWNASLSFTDAASGTSLDLRRLTLNTSQSRPFDFSLSCEVTVNPYGLTGELSAKGEASYGETGGHVLVHSSTATGWLTLPAGTAAPGERVAFTGKVMVHGQQGAFEVSSMVLEGLGARVTGKVNAAGLYDPVPYVYANLAASGGRRGAWTKLLGLDLAGRAPTDRAGTPALRQAAPEGDIEAELELSSTPSGWLANKAVLRDGPARVGGTAKNIGGDVSFDLSADGWDLGSWLTPAALPGGRAGGWAGNGVKSLSGRFSGRNLRAGTLDIEDLEFAARSGQSEFRIYPFTARVDQGMFSADIRVKPDPAVNVFSVSAALTPLTQDGPGAGQPQALGEVNMNGEAGPSGVTGKLRLALGDFARNWKPSWMPRDASKAWELLGGGAAQASFTLPRSGEWGLDGLDVRTGGSRFTGRIAGGRAATVLDLQADRLELEKLRQLAALFGADGRGFAPVPLEGRIAAKRLSLPGLDVDDLLLAGQAAPEALKLSTVSGSALGGKFTGGIEMESARGSAALSMTLAASGMQGAALSAQVPHLPKIAGPVACQVSAESQSGTLASVWQGLHGQADLQMGQGSVTFSPGEAGALPWPVSRATASLKFSAKPAPQGGERVREAALADVSGLVKVDSPGVVRSSQVEVKGQVGLDASGRPLWFRQPRAEGSHLLSLGFLGPGKTARATWAGRIEADFDTGGFSLSGVDLNLAGVPGKVSVAGQPGPSGQGGPVLSGSVDIPEFNPRDAAPRLGLSLPAGADPNVWRRARFSCDIGGTLKEVRLTRIQASLDDAIISGQALVSGPKNRLDLAVSSLDLDRLAPVPQAADQSKRPEEPLPLAELRELNLEAKVRFGWLMKDRLVWENALTEFSAQGGRFQLRQTAPSFYGGPYLFDLRGDARGGELKAQLELKLSGFSAPALLKDLAGAETLTKGQCDFSVNVEMHGATDRALRRKASGSAGFEVRSGALAIRGAPAKRDSTAAPVVGDRDAPPPPPPPSDGVPFSKMGANFSVREGLAVTRDLVLTGPTLTAKGDGWVSLDDERIDLNLMASVPEVGEVPVRISGSLYDPRLDIDKSKVLGDTLMNLFKGVIGIPGNVLNQLRRVF
ncbi:AsmA family protein [Fundidesulfovibrio terrae]|uniref:AsmA family protein n=1 Tax=Fundidesulfovibrio terrae TaxID=2922866 RepID=UPI001FAF5C20|nr:AsmA family protein [Fundidesulfovibrio terrae]